MTFEIDYTKLTERGLRDLINQGDPKAEDEYHRRVFSGEIKRKSYPFEEFEKLWKEGKFGYKGLTS